MYIKKPKVEVDAVCCFKELHFTRIENPRTRAFLLPNLIRIFPMNADIRNWANDVMLNSRPIKVSSIPLLCASGG